MRVKTMGVARLLFCAAMVLLAGCSHVSGSKNRTEPGDIDNPGSEIRQIVIQLLVNSGALDKIYDNLHDAAAEEAGNSTNDIQLGNIQKTYLYV